MTDGLHARLHVVYPDFHLDVDLQLPGDGVSALFGPSGSGKTTCLRAIAGLQRARHAQVWFNGEVWQDEAGVFVPTHRRALAYVFQEASLFAHLSVRGNLEYGLKRSGGTADPATFGSTTALLGIEGLLGRMPDRLSGGERQRVAIARALLSRPKLLLMDEPLAAIDVARREEILPYLERLREELRIPIVYVSHSLDEVCRLADQLVMLDRGSVVASGPLVDTLARIDLPGAALDRASVVIEATVAATEQADHLTRLDFPGGTLWVPARGHTVGSGVRCRIDARDVSLTLDRQTGTSILNLVPATVVAVAQAQHPAQLLVRLDAGGSPLLAQLTRRSWDALVLEPGRSVWAQIKAVALIG